MNGKGDLVSRTPLGEGVIIHALAAAAYIVAALAFVFVMLLPTGIFG
jgi:hypothetical protein